LSLKHIAVWSIAYIICIFITINLRNEKVFRKHCLHGENSSLGFSEAVLQTNIFNSSSLCFQCTLNTWTVSLTVGPSQTIVLTGKSTALSSFYIRSPMKNYAGKCSCIHVLTFVVLHWSDNIVSTTPDASHVFVLFVS